MPLRAVRPSTGKPPRKGGGGRWKRWGGQRCPGRHHQAPTHSAMEAPKKFPSASEVHNFQPILLLQPGETGRRETTVPRAACGRGRRRDARLVLHGWLVQPQAALRDRHRERLPGGDTPRTHATHTPGYLTRPWSPGRCLLPSPERSRRRWVDFERRPRRAPGPPVWPRRLAQPGDFRRRGGTGVV